MAQKDIYAASEKEVINLGLYLDGTQKIRQVKALFLGQGDNTLEFLAIDPKTPDKANPNLLKFALFERHIISQGENYLQMNNTPIVVDRISPKDPRYEDLIKLAPRTE